MSHRLMSVEANLPVRARRSVLILTATALAVGLLACEGSDTDLNGSPASASASPDDGTRVLSGTTDDDTAADGAATDEAVNGDSTSGETPEDGAPDDSATPFAPAEIWEARLRDGELVLAAEDGSTLVTYDLTDEPGEPVHAVLRPGTGTQATIVTVFRVAHDELGVTYELRYLVVDDEAVSELYWFPWRLQVDARLAEVADVAPTPVWSPEGDALAWIEWDGEQTRLRIVGWFDDGTSSNPTDGGTSYALRDVPPGTQLRAWSGGPPALFTGDAPGGEVVEIELAVGPLALTPPLPPGSRVG